MKYTETDLNEIIGAVLESAKYRHVCPDLIRRIGGWELAVRPNPKAAIQETKGKLHQIAGAYLASTPNYAKWRAEMVEAGGLEALKPMALQWMQSHASTRERLPIIERFYKEVFADIGPIHSVVDIACGLNPLAVPWMGLAENVQYRAYDLYTDMSAFLTEYLHAAGVDGEAFPVDCAVHPPEEPVDLAIILKFLPVLEQVEKGATLSWLKRLNARYLLISFPTRSLGGRSKGMAQNYEARFLEMTRDEPWAVKKHLFENELCFLTRT